jgi:hypothetical protein
MKQIGSIKFERLNIASGETVENLPKRRFVFEEECLR